MAREADIAARDYTFRASGSTIKFDGFLRVYTEGKDDGVVDYGSGSFRST